VDGTRGRSSWSALCTRRAGEASDDVGVDGPAGAPVVVDQAGLADLAHDRCPLDPHHDDRGLDRAVVAPRRRERFDFDVVAGNAGVHAVLAIDEEEREPSTPGARGAHVLRVGSASATV